VKGKAAGAVVLVLLAVVFGLFPVRETSKVVLLRGIELYQHEFSGFFPAIHCRMKPTCSSYAEICISRFGPWKGSLLALKRILRCGPWVPEGQKDPPPPRKAVASGAGSAYPASGVPGTPRGNYASLPTSHP